MPDGTSTRAVLLHHELPGDPHLDLMLERAGDGREHRLVTFRLDESPIPGGDLPARKLADHRAFYLDHEGEVAGGRGTVRRIAAGEVHAMRETDSEIEATGILGGTRFVARFERAAGDLWRVRWNVMDPEGRIG